MANQNQECWLCCQLFALNDCRTKRCFDAGEIESEKYISLLKAIELFSYRVFLWEGRRSDAGLSLFYRWAGDIFAKKTSVEEVRKEILGTINWHSKEDNFRKQLQEEFYDWYSLGKKLLKYTLYEYELWLLESEGKGAKPKLAWREFDSYNI